VDFKEREKMAENSVIDLMMRRRSVRKYSDEMPSQEVIETIVRAGQQAPFAFQMCSLLLSKERENHPFKAPLLFTICVDSHRHETIMARRGWELATNDLSLLFFGIQDAAYMAENMVMAAESLGLGSCFIGRAIYQAEEIKEAYQLPPRVLPLVQLTMGYPDEDRPTRPRYPIDFCLFEGQYPEYSEEQVQRAMQEMDEGYMDQAYYKRVNLMIDLQDGKEETHTFETYGWTEHISRKTGQWLRNVEDLTSQLEACGFRIDEDRNGGSDVQEH
jgi:nitroreductase